MSRRNQTLSHEAERRTVALELRKKADESKMEYEFEDALAKDDFVSNNADIMDEELSELPVDSVNDRVSRLGTNSARFESKSV